MQKSNLRDDHHAAAAANDDAAANAAAAAVNANATVKLFSQNENHKRKK